ncbi:hypothetical protein [Streptomyces sp. NPDC003299]
MERTEQPPMQPSPPPLGVLTEPSYAAQVLIVAARVLRLGDTAGAIHPSNVHDALNTGENAILTTLPDTVRADASARARGALPQLTRITCGEYAERLDDAAKGL